MMVNMDIAVIKFSAIMTRHETVAKRRVGALSPPPPRRLVSLARRVDRIGFDARVKRCLLVSQQLRLQREQDGMG